MTKHMEIIYDKVSMPVGHTDYVPVNRTRETMEEHQQKVLEKMKEKALDVLMVYGDREHGANYAYLTGFETRFEESILVLHKDGTCYLMLGNENLKMCNYSFIKAATVHVPHFSLPHQPMETEKTLDELFAEAGVKNGMKIGIAGWKLFTSRLEDNSTFFDMPAFMVDAVRRVNSDGILVNAADIFLDAEYGVRHVMNANEIAHYEYGAGLASSKVLAALNAVAPGKTELELADLLTAGGQPLSVTTICATGERFTDAVVFPRNKKVTVGDKLSLTLGLRGGLTSRSAYIVGKQEELPAEVQDYVEKVAIPYYRAAVTWYETVGIGVSCDELYKTIDEVLPKAKYGWTLNPGHYTGQDEWTASPVYPGSQVKIQSGMMFQMDIIPSVPGYGGVSAEDGIAIADEALREELKNKYPDTWKRIEDRRRFMIEELGINLKAEVLPMSDIGGYLRPYVLNHGYALKKG